MRFQHVAQQIAGLKESIDHFGAQTEFLLANAVKQIFQNAILIFILPPSWSELKSRLQRRGEDSSEVIDVRIQNAAKEVAHVKEFDFVIINERFELALFDLKSIVHAQRLKYSAQRRAKADTFSSLQIP